MMTTPTQQAPAEFLRPLTAEEITQRVMVTDPVQFAEAM